MSASESTGFDGAPYTREEFEAELEQPRRLKIVNLGVDFATDHGVVRAVDDIWLASIPGEVLALVGESGSGKWVDRALRAGTHPRDGERYRHHPHRGYCSLWGCTGLSCGSYAGERASMVFQELIRIAQSRLSHLVAGGRGPEGAQQEAEEKGDPRARRYCAEDGGHPGP